MILERKVIWQYEAPKLSCDISKKNSFCETTGFTKINYATGSYASDKPEKSSWADKIQMKVDENEGNNVYGMRPPFLFKSTLDYPPAIRIKKSYIYVLLKNEWTGFE